MKTMRPTRLNARLPVVAALGAAIAATIFVGSARAEDDGKTFEQKIIGNILTGIGLQDPNAVQPTYEERPPLVIPKGDNLPAPQKPGAAIATNPAWPKDPDVTRAKAMAKAERHRDIEAEMERDQNPLLPSELGPKGRQGRATPGAAGPDPFDGVVRESPSQLGYTGGLFSSMFGSDKKDEESARFTGEPARTSLTEPPPGYQTPSPNQPYGVGAKNQKPKADNYYLTHGTDY